MGRSVATEMLEELMRTVLFLVLVALTVSACSLYFDDDPNQITAVPDAGSTHGDGGDPYPDADVTDGGVGSGCGDDGGGPIGDAAVEDAGSGWEPDASPALDAHW